jgi:hypothetical protein
MARARRKLSEFKPPPGLRRGSFVIREALRRATLRQHPAALKAAARMMLALPLVQGFILVALFLSEPWLLLVAAEGLLIALLAASQLKRPTPENRLIGYGVALANLLAVGGAGLFLSAYALTFTSLAALFPVTLLVFAPTGRRTLAGGWVCYAMPLLVIAVLAGFSRAQLSAAATELDAPARMKQLAWAWAGLQVRGGNGTERALLRLRQAQAAMAAGDWERAFGWAHDGVFRPEGDLRRIPESAIGADLLESLLRVKAQAHYNRRWQRAEIIQTRIGAEPVDAELLREVRAAVRWGW